MVRPGRTLHGWLLAACRATPAPPQSAGPGPDDTPCNDEDWCTEDDACWAGFCLGTDRTCDDDDPCTIDTCNSGEMSCDHEEMWPGPWKSCARWDCDISVTVPGLMFVNNDDDNLNGVADLHDCLEEGIAGENDLGHVSLAFSGCPPEDCQHEGTSWTMYPAPFDGVYWDYPHPEKPGCTFLDWADWPPPANMYLEGHECTDACGAPLLFWVHGYIRSGRSACACWDYGDPIIVATVTSLRWETRDPTNIPLDECPNNAGRRIFPGKIDPNDQFPEFRKQVKLVAEVCPAIAGLTVHFKVWDVDDPFDQLHGPGSDDEIVGVELVDGDQDGPDNRGSDPAPGTYSEVTDENVRAVKIITVSMQTGDNYRAGASLLQDAMTQATQTNADELSVWSDGVGGYAHYGWWDGYKCPLVWSQMLTVWRKLHVEVDSMNAEPTTTDGRGPDWYSIYVAGVTPNATTSTLHLGWDFQGSSPHQYEGGTVTITTPGVTLDVRDNTADTLEVYGVLTPGEIALITDHWGVVKDDDPNGGLLTHFYTMTPFIKAAYADGYVDIVDIEDQFNPTQYVGFEFYVSYGDMLTGGAWNDSKDRDSADDYWTALVVAGYQADRDHPLAPHRTQDGDPDLFVDNSTYPECPCWPAEYCEDRIAGVTASLGDWDSIVFRAACVDVPRHAHHEEQVVAHEIGHSAGNTGDADEHHGEGGLMAASDKDENVTSFTGSTLKRFREATKW